MIPRSRSLSLAVVIAALATSGACARRDEGAPSAAGTMRLPVDVIADSGASMRWNVRAPLDGAVPAPATGAEVWLARVAPAPPEAMTPPLPAAVPETLVAAPAEPPRLEVDEDLKPPIPRRPARLVLPAGARPGSVALDVRVDEEGRVSDAEWAGGSSDPALVRAAIECALAMEFFPALQGGRAVPVWCRQRFDFSRR